MRKIESVIGYDGIARNLVELEDEFYRAIVRRGNPFEKLTEVNIQTLMPAGNILTLPQKRILKIFRLNSRNFILAIPDMMQDFISRIDSIPDFKDLFFDNNKATRFSLAIQKALNYKGFRKAKTKGIWLAQKLNIKVCPYCNTQYTLVINNGENHKAKFQFDHFFPKSRYPFFSLSFLVYDKIFNTLNIS
jgi:hypothetical protein